LRTPIEILPDGRIITGHLRVRAAKLLGWTEIDVIVRDDLAAAGAVAIEQYLIEQSSERRHLSPLARARCIKHLLAIEENRGLACKTAGETETFKVNVAKRMNISSRNVNRYLVVLELPVSLQHAINRGPVSLINAGKIARMNASVHREIAQRIEAGENAAEVVGEYLARAKNED